MSTINERITYLLDQDDLSIRGAAKELGISPAAVQNIRSGRSKPNAETLEKIAESYATVDTRWLLTGEGQPFLQSVEMLLAEETVSTGNFGLSPKPSTGNPPPQAISARPVVSDVNNIDNDNFLYSGHLYIPEAAHGGYAEGFADAGYAELGVYALDFPGLPRPGRTFEVSGNSMEPILAHGDLIVCSQVDVPQSLREGLAYVLVSATAGVSVKYLRRGRDHVLAIPANQQDYSPVRYDLGDIRELWLVEWRVTRHFLNPVAPYVAEDFGARLSAIEQLLVRQFPHFGIKK